MLEEARPASLFQLVVVLNFDLIKKPLLHEVAALARALFLCILLVRSQLSLPLLPRDKLEQTFIVFYDSSIILRPPLLDHSELATFKVARVLHCTPKTRKAFSVA